MYILDNNLTDKLDIKIDLVSEYYDAALSKFERKNIDEFIDKGSSSVIKKTKKL